MPPGETPIRVDPKEAALSAYSEAISALADKTLPPNKQQAEYCRSMLAWATFMLAVEQNIKFSKEATEWSKRLDVALDGLYRDELADLTAKLERFNEDATKLKSLL